MPSHMVTQRFQHPVLMSHELTPNIMKALPHAQRERALPATHLQPSFLRAPNTRRFGIASPHPESSVGFNRPLLGSPFAHSPFRTAAGAIAGGALVQHLMSHPREQMPVTPRMERASQYRSIVPGAPIGARPREIGPVIERLNPPIARQMGPRLAWGPGAMHVPRAGNAHMGIPGAIDPGGYLRGTERPLAYLTPRFAMQQFAAFNPNFAQFARLNNQNLVADRSLWPWRLPPYAPGWFNRWQGNWAWPQSNWWGWQQPGYDEWWNNWEQTGYNNWWNGYGYYNGGGIGAFSGFLAGLMPWGMNSDLGWIPDMNYYNAYNWDGDNYPGNYFATTGYVPTQYVFDVATGQFWDVGEGFTDYLPANYDAPITVAADESVPDYDQEGRITGYEVRPFYYNAFWDQNAQAYGYYDYRQEFHWLTFPWLNCWAAG